MRLEKYETKKRFSENMRGRFVIQTVVGTRYRFETGSSFKNYFIR